MTDRDIRELFDRHSGPRAHVEQDLVAVVAGARRVTRRRRVRGAIAGVSMVGALVFAMATVPGSDRGEDVTMMREPDGSTAASSTRATNSPAEADAAGTGPSGDQDASSGGVGTVVVTDSTVSGPGQATFAPGTVGRRDGTTPTSVGDTPITSATAPHVPVGSLPEGSAPVASTAPMPTPSSSTAATATTASMAPTSTAPDLPSSTTATTTATTATTTATTTVTTTVTTLPTTTTTGVQEETYVVQGGTVRIRWTSTQLTLLSVTPNAGYTVEQEVQATEIDVEFDSPGHESKVHVSLSGGSLHEEIVD